MKDMLGDWAARAQDGDKEALRRLVEALHREAFGFALQCAERREDAPDLVQAGWLHVLENLSQYRREEGPFRPWFYRVLYNLWVSHKRKRSAGPWPERLDPADGADPSDEAGRRELLRSAERAIEHLSPREVQVLFRYINGEPYGSIAASAGVSRVYARKIVERALCTLREVLSQEDGHDAR